MEYRNQILIGLILVSAGGTIICFLLPWFKASTLGLVTLSGATLGGVMWLIPLLAVLGG